MYPRNNATPERIAIGQVVLIADGTIQTADVVITVRGQGGAEATGGGTTAYGAEGTVYYTPTQAETNFTSFVVIASKASSFSASQTVITTQSATAGQVRLEGVTHTSAVIPTVSVNSDMRGTDNANTTAPDNAGIAGIQTDLDNTTDGLGAIKTSVDAIPTTPMRGTDNALLATDISLAAGAVTVGTNNDKTGYALSQAFPANFADLAVTLTTGNVTVGTNNDKITGFATEAKQDIIDTNVDAVLLDTNELQTNQGAWATATGFATEAKQDAQDLIITESRLAELDAANLPADISANLTAINALNDPTAAAVAAAVAAFDMGNGRTIEEALAFLRNKWTIIDGILTVYDTDDTTILWTSAMTQTAGDNVSASDPV